MERRRRLWEILEPGGPGDAADRGFEGFIFVLIVLNVIAVILETVEPIYANYVALFEWFDVFSIAVFTAEYVARVWACTEDPRYRRPLVGRLRYMVTPMAIVDLLAVVPFYFAYLTYDLRVFRAIRLFRILRIAKLGRYSRSLRMFARVFSKNREELVLTGFVMAILAVVASSLMYFAEHEAQPDKFPDIPATMWWAVVTLTTVGYGDVFPITTAGKFFAAVFAILGIGMFALPTGILGASFVDEIQRAKTGKNCCPHCGKEVE